jgi:hypothetical protein
MGQVDQNFATYQRQPVLARRVGATSTARLSAFAVGALLALRTFAVGPRRPPRASQRDRGPERSRWIHRARAWPARPRAFRLQ